ncbi:MAG: C4-type zinc ribbon domain-containing protein [Melioribacteraceae bacterium]|nr:C4-type zinc ribbon domain-containing protein [Melioribacteraceae bacterium]
MINRLSTLFQLQLIDDELDTLQELRGDLPIEVNTLTSQIENIKITLDEKEKEKEDALETMKTNEDEIERLNTSLKKFKSQLYQVRNNKEYDALTKEIDHSEEKIKTFEDEILELENRVQTLKSEIEEVKPQLEELTADLEVKEEELKQIIKSNEREETKLSATRDDVASKVRKSDYNTYTRIRKALGGKAVVTISRGACTGCHNVVPPQRQIEIRNSKRLFTCESCGRLLISPNVASEVKSVG